LKCVIGGGITTVGSTSMSIVIRARDAVAGPWAAATPAASAKQTVAIDRTKMAIPPSIAVAGDRFVK
jgi:hypothetical protein